MISFEMVNQKTGVVVESCFFNEVYEAKQRAIRLGSYAGFLDFKKDRDGDLSAKNRIFKVDIVRV